MSKFNTGQTTPREARSTTPISTTTVVAPTHEGGAGFLRDAKSELFLLSVTNMVGEDTFYESATDRDARFAALVRQVTQEDPTFVVKLLPWLRTEAFMRSAPLVAAAEYARAEGPGVRQVVDSVVRRADEPAEMLAYWLGTYGRKVPRGIKRGLADAVRRLYTERNVLKYDGQDKPVRFADVIELVHPEPSNEYQALLFKHIIDRRHNRPDAVPAELAILVEDHRLQRLPVEDRLANLDAAVRARWSWERLLSWLPAEHKTKAWEALVPNMGYMALLRNLRNIEAAGVDKAVIDAVVARLSDPEAVAGSMQFPYRFLSAWKATQSMTFGPALETALDLSCSNIPELTGDTLVLIDVSSSMNATLSAKTQVQRWEAGALFAFALAKRAERVRVVLFGTNSKEIVVGKASSVLRSIQAVPSQGASLGWGTNAHPALYRHYRGEQRVVIFTDEQVHPHASVEPQVPVLYTFNLGGYRVAGFEGGKPGRHTLGGFSDATFRLMALVEQFQSGGWDALFTTQRSETA